jgi:hypothetical protein
MTDKRVPLEGSEIGWLLLHVLLQHRIRTSNRTSNRSMCSPSPGVQSGDIRHRSGQKRTGDSQEGKGSRETEVCDEWKGRK